MAVHPESLKGVEEAAIMHTLPTCSRYEREDPRTFLKSVNSVLAKRCN
jgi:hypothetical protein